MDAKLPDGNPKSVYGMQKPGMEGLPTAPLFQVGMVMRLGVQKYGPTNWRHDPVSASVYYSAALRHLMSWWDGQDTDRESGQPHLAHVAACMMILMDADLCDTLLDDRPAIPGPTAHYIESNTKRKDAET
jgi:hypothetical protein